MDKDRENDSRIPKFRAGAVAGPSRAGSGAKQGPPLKRNTLRRRSRSVTDLTALQKEQHEPLRLRRDLPNIVERKGQGLKRPLKNVLEVPVKAKTVKTDEVPAKPRNAAKKIPDWDYKSRFQDLLEKHNALKSKMEEARQQLVGVPALHEEIRRLKQEKVMLGERVPHLEGTIENLRRQIEVSNAKEAELSASVAHLRRENDACQQRCEDQERRCKEAEESLRQVAEDLKKSKSAADSVHEMLVKSQIKCSQLEETLKEFQTKIDEDEDLRRTLHNTILDLKGNMRVFCRVRPPLEGDRMQECDFTFPDDASMEIRKTRDSVSATGKIVEYKQEFSFDRVFSQHSTQNEIFEELSLLVQSVVDGYNVCVFAYGQTGSGKTYTMQGTKEHPGVIPRAIDFLFDKISNMKKTNWHYTLTCGFTEVYNETLKDLLNLDAPHPPTVQCCDGVATIKNLTIRGVNSAIELKGLMERALGYRATAATNFNQNSSRSHAVSIIKVKSTNTTSGITYEGTLNLVDLAGSESAKTSDRLEETKNINKSLSSLSKVMLALYNNDRHIPYRDSKLTFMLQSSLGGNSKTLMLANIAPYEECYGESLNSLRFAARVKEVKTSTKKNKV